MIYYVSHHENSACLNCPINESAGYGNCVEVDFSFYVTCVWGEWVPVTHSGYDEVICISSRLMKSLD